MMGMNQDPTTADDATAVVVKPSTAQEQEQQQQHQQRRSSSYSRRRRYVTTKSLLVYLMRLMIGIAAYACNKSWVTKARRAIVIHQAAADTNINNNNQYFRRLVTIMGGDNDDNFASVNDLLQHQVLELYLNNVVDVMEQQSGMKIQLQTLVCTGFNVGSVDIEWSRHGGATDASSTAAADNDSNMSSNDLSTTTPVLIVPPPINLTEFEENVDIHFNTTLQDLYFTCIGDFDFEFFGGNMTGQGQVYMETTRTGNQMVLGHVLAIDNNDDDHSETTAPRGSFSPTTFINTPPNILQIQTCQATMEVEKVYFYLMTTTMSPELEAYAEKMLNAMDLREMYAQVIQDYLCAFVPDEDQHDSSDEPDMLETFAALIEKYLPSNSTTTRTNKRTTDDLLAMERALKLPSDLKAVNFMFPKTPISHILHQFLLTGLAHDDNGSSPPFPSSNFLGDLLFNNHEYGEMKFDLDSILLSNNDTNLQEWATHYTLEMPTPFGNLTFRFRELTILEYPEYSILSMNIVGNHTLETKLQVANVKIRLAVEITSVNLYNMTFEPQTLHVEVPLDPFTVSVAMLLVFDENKVTKLILDGLLSDKRHSLFNDCFQSVIYKSEVITVTMSNPVGLGQPYSSGLEDFSPGVSRIAAAFVDIFYAGFGPSISRAIPNVFQSKMVETMNQRLQAAMTMTVAAAAAGTCNIGNLDDLVRVGGRFFVERGSSLVKRGALVEFDRSIRLGETNVRLQFILDNFRIENIDSIGDLSVFDPIPSNPSVFNNSITLGVPPRPLRISTSMVFGLTLNDKESFNDAEITLSLLGSQLITQILVRISEAGLSSISIQDMLDLDFNCILPRLLGVPKLNVHGVRLDDRPFLSFENVDFVSHGAINIISFDCVECKSRSFQEIDNLLQHPEEHRAAISRVEEVINWIFSTFVEGESSFVQTLLDRMLVDVSKQCEDTIIKEVDVQYQPFDHVIQDNESDSIQYILAMLIALGALLFFYFGICICFRCDVARRQRKLLQTSSVTQLMAIYNAQQKRDEAHTARNKLSKSMFQSKEVPWFARCVVPLLVMGSLAFFLLGHWSIGASARVYIQLAGEELMLDDVYDISIAQIALNLWNTGERATSTVVILFSLIWPYFELLSILVLWFMPTFPPFLSMQRRGVILTWLHWLSKWCMVNVFILVVVMAAFRISISNPQESFLPRDLYAIDLLVAPGRGLYEQLTAQVLLQVNFHFILMYQRRIQAAVNAEYKEAIRVMDIENEKSEASESDSPDETDDKAELHSVAIASSSVAAPERTTPRRETNALHQCIGFARPHRGKEETDGLVVRRGVYVIVAALVAMLLLILVCAGCALPSFSTNVQGIVGVLIGFGRGDGTSTYYHSVFSIAKLLVEMTDFLNTTRDIIGLVFVMTFFIITTFVATIALVGCHFFRWFCYHGSTPRSNRTLRVDIWIEILEAWQYLELYIVIVLVVVWQLPDISELVLNDSYCNDNEEMKSFFASMSHYNILDSENGDAQCFRLQSRIESGLYIILAPVCGLLPILRRIFTVQPQVVEENQKS